MANVQIPNLPAVAALSGAELFEGVQAGTSVKISLSQVIAATRGGTPTTIPIPVSLGGTGASTLTGYVKGSGTTPFTGSATIPNTDITGLGTMSTQNANAVAITGGSITGITDLAVADGGTGASTLTGYVKGSGTSPLTASATIPNTDITGLGTMSTQNANAVAITGGTINGTTIGGTTASSIAGTTGTFSGVVSVTANSTTDAFRITQTGTGNALVVEDSANPDSSPFTIDAAGIMLVGLTSNQEANLATNAKVQIFGSTAPLALYRDADSSTAINLEFAKRRATGGILANNDVIGRLYFSGNDGVAAIPAAFIDAAVDGTPSVNDMPGRLVFSTTLDGAAAPTERMRITNAGRLGIGTVSPSTLLDVAGTANATNMTRGGSQVYSRDNILATVSQSAGVPTGGIIERGSSANGEYVRYADGTMICVIYAAGTQTTSTASGSIFRATNASTWTFPSTFAVAPAVSGMAEENNTRWVAFDLPTTTAVAFRHLNSLTSAVAVNTRLMAIGRWF
jgi:hypothetical protein